MVRLWSKVHLWLHRRSLHRLSGAATGKLHEVAMLLCTIREHRPDAADRINMLLDEVIYPTIHDIYKIEEDLCPTSKKTDEQKSTLTLVK